MTSRLGLRLLALALPVALLAPAAAYARTLTVVDGAGDAKALNVALIIGGELDDSPLSAADLFLDAPAETSVDVVSTTIDHAEKRLTLTVQFRDLVETDGHGVMFRIFTPDGSWGLYAGKAGDRTNAELLPQRLEDRVYHRNLLRCRTVRARYDLAADMLTASVPTACLLSPAWVQVGARVTRDKVTPLGDGSVNLASYTDDPFRGGVSIMSLGRSPKVPRG